MEVYPSMGSSSYDIILKTKAKCRYSRRLRAGEGTLESGIPAAGTAEEGDAPGRRAGILAPTPDPRPAPRAALRRLPQRTADGIRGAVGRGLQ